jgi:hypothetical protein
MSVDFLYAALIIHCIDCSVAESFVIAWAAGMTRVSMHSRTAIRFYKIHTALTEAVLPDSGNYKTIVSLFYQLL